MKIGQENLASEADRVDLDLLILDSFGSALCLFDRLLGCSSILLVRYDYRNEISILVFYLFFITFFLVYLGYSSSC